MREHKLYLKDILAAMNAIEEFTGDMDFDEFVKDDKTSSAVVRKFEIIGEAAKNIPDHIRHKYPQIPWKKMAGMRDVLIHFYFGIDYKLVWQAIRNDIPSIKPVISKVINDFSESK